MKAAEAYAHANRDNAIDCLSEAIDIYERDGHLKVQWPTSPLHTPDFLGPSSEEMRQRWRKACEQGFHRHCGGLVVPLNAHFPPDVRPNISGHPCLPPSRSPTAAAPLPSQTNARLHRRIAELYERTGDFKDSIDFYLQAAEYYEGPNQMAYVFLGRVEAHAAHTRNARMGMAVTAAQTYYGADPESEWPGMVCNTWATALLSRGLVGVLSHGVHTRQTLE